MITRTSLSRATAGRDASAFLASFCLAFALATGPATAQPLALPDGLISLASDDGAVLLTRSTARRAYIPLANQFVTQKNQAYCGVASLVMVLNALGVDAPAAPGFEPFKTFTQDNALNDGTEPILAQAVLMKQGMTLDQFGRLVERYGVAADVRHAGDVGVEPFRALASRQLASKDRYVVVNYLRRALGQEQGGHLSPLGAYDAASDRFLVLDVSRYKYPPVWVGAAALHAAMNTVDKDNEGRTRGFVLIGGVPPAEAAPASAPASAAR